ncbi:MAG: LacI family transcriptional regulator [Opitutaceae bacterium]|jgi:DNA-binding LacI/PurR family transcriptional regulator|nr:LacI family transcriptional regulator [Opitutaceae bacterium]
MNPAVPVHPASRQPASPEKNGDLRNAGNDKTPEKSSVPTVRELAARLGISHTTVAFALRNSPRVSPETRKRVLAAAQAAGYRKNPLVNALMAQVRQRHRLKPTGEVVAFLTSHATEDDWRRHPSLVQQFDGARKRAQELGFDLQPVWMGDVGEHSWQAARVLAARGVRGSVLAPIGIHHRTLELDWTEHAVVTIGYSFRQVSLHRAVHDNVNLAMSCYSHLRKTGYRRIGMAMLKQDNERVRHSWLTGFLGAQHVHGGARVAPLLFSDYTDPAPFLEWFERRQPDAVIGIWQNLPLTWLRERGVRVPEETGYATLDVGDCAGRLAGMLQDNRGVGAAAMDLLGSQLFRNEIGIPKTPTVTMIEGTWVDGPTVARRE